MDREVVPKEYGLAVRVYSAAFDASLEERRKKPNTIMGLVNRARRVSEAFYNLRGEFTRLKGYPYLQTQTVEETIEPSKLLERIGKIEGVYPIFTFLPFGRVGSGNYEQYRISQLQKAINAGFPYVEVLPRDLPHLEFHGESRIICSHFDGSKTPSVDELERTFRGMYNSVLQANVGTPVIFKIQTCAKSDFDPVKILRFVRENGEPDFWSQGVVGTCLGEGRKARLSRLQAPFYGSSFTLGGPEMERDLGNIESRIKEMIWESHTSEPLAI